MLYSSKIKLFCQNIKKSSLLYMNRNLMLLLHAKNPVIAFIGYYDFAQVCRQALESGNAASK